MLRRLKDANGDNFRALGWGWEFLIANDVVYGVEEFIKRGLGTRVWQLEPTISGILLYVLDGELQVEHWQLIDGMASIDRNKPIIRLHKGETLVVEPNTVYRLAGVTDARYLQLSVGKPELTVKPISDTGPTAVPE